MPTKISVYMASARNSGSGLTYMYDSLQINWQSVSAGSSVVSKVWKFLRLVSNCEAKTRTGTVLTAKLDSAKA